MKTSLVTAWNLSRALMAMNIYRLEGSPSLQEDDIGAIRKAVVYMRSGVRSYEALKGKTPEDRLLSIGGEVPLEEVEAELEMYKAFGGDVFRKKEITRHASVLESVGEGKTPSIEEMNTTQEFVLKLLDYLNSANAECTSYF